jgi:hypothetical protein
MIKTLKQNEVFVFGSNLTGFHGAGAAGYATFGEHGNVWRNHNYDKVPNGTKGKWNVKGQAEGYQRGTEGASYALPTVKRPKQPLPKKQIIRNIHKFFVFAKSHPHLTFLVAYGAKKKNLNGYTAEEMAQMFFEGLVGRKPKNVKFEKEFQALIAEQAKGILINHSGGANGADTEWDLQGRKYGVLSRHYYLHGNNVPPLGNVPMVWGSKALQAQIDNALKAANTILRRTFPTRSEWTNALLRRNYFQVSNSDTILAVGKFDTGKNRTHLVAGGTAWAVYMAVIAKRTIYFYDQVGCNWYQWHYTLGKFVKQLEEPKLTGNFAGIGSREINQHGKAAIAEVYKNHFNKTI